MSATVLDPAVENDVTMKKDSEETSRLLYAGNKQGETPRKLTPWLFERPNYLRSGYLYV